MRCFAVGDLADAAHLSGLLDDARPVIAELERLAAHVPSPVLHAGLRFARPLLAADDQAEAVFLDSVAANAAWPFLRARTQLAFGAWLRRQRRMTESRGPLRAARDAFDALGTLPWSERAREELRAAGEASRRRMPAARDELTPQELQIAQLAAAGLTNVEIGQRLYLSHRTVGSHLYRIFPKLDITSRAELRDVLEPAGSRAA
jgi:DNA-binding CsgD family transcriptional regulator